MNNETSKNKACDSRFVTRKWNIVNDHSNTNYAVGIEIIYKNRTIKIQYYSNACILVRGNINVHGHNQATQVANICAPFAKCTTKIDGTTYMMLMI